jgi:hypothetical protein
MSVSSTKMLMSLLHGKVSFCAFSMSHLLKRASRERTKKEAKEERNEGINEESKTQRRTNE